MSGNSPLKFETWDLVAVPDWGEAEWWAGAPSMTCDCAVRGTKDPGLPPQHVDRGPARWRSNNQHAHCHPGFTPDREASPESSGGGGKAVLYTSDLTGYSNMYLVEVGEFGELPDLA